MCAPIYKAFKESLNEIPGIDKQETIAEGIAIAKPIRGKQIIEAVKKTKVGYEKDTVFDLVERKLKDMYAKSRAIKDEDEKPKKTKK